MTSSISIRRRPMVGSVWSQEVILMDWRAEAEMGGWQTRGSGGLEVHGTTRRMTDQGGAGGMREPGGI